MVASRLFLVVWETGRERRRSGLAGQAKKIFRPPEPGAGTPVIVLRRRRRPPDLRPATAGLSPPHLILDDATSADLSGPPFLFPAGQRRGARHYAGPERKPGESAWPGAIVSGCCGSGRWG